MAEISALITAKLGELDAGADHYQLLGVTRDVSQAALRAAYFALAKKLHPDRLRAAGVVDNPGDAQRLFAQINEAFGALSSPARRAEYDAALAQGAGGQEAEDLAMRIVTAEQHFLRGEMALRRSQIEAALAEFQQAVALNPDEAEHHALLAWATFCAAPDKHAVMDQVRQGLVRAIELSPRCVAAHLYRGQVASGVGDVEGALACFRRVLELDPEHREAALQLRLLEGRLNKVDPRKKGLLDRLKRR